MQIRSLSAFLACYFCLAVAFAQTPVSGGIYSNTTWTLANSPYVMTAKIVVFPGVTLTIEPGVEVLIDPPLPGATSTTALEIRGRLDMRGTATQKIRFRSSSDSTLVHAWDGLYILNSQGAVLDMAHTSIKNAYMGVMFDVALPKTLVEGCEFAYNYYGYFSGGPASFVDCKIINNGIGISCSYQNDSVWVDHCLFDSNGFGLYSGYSPTQVTRSTFIDNFNYGVQGGLPGSAVRTSSFIGNYQGIAPGTLSLIDSCDFQANTYGINEAEGTHIRRSTFSQNVYGLVVGKGSLTEGNQINGNQTGIATGIYLQASDVLPVIVNNQICGNTLYNFENASNLNYALDSNCFCLPDSAAIDSLILDGYDDISRGLVNFSVYDSTCTSVIFSVVKVFIPTGATVADLPQLAVYPNPSNGRVQVRLSEALDTMAGQVLDLQGRVLQRFHLQNGQQQLDFSGLAPGIYQISLQSQDGTRWTSRLIRE